MKNRKLRTSSGGRRLSRAISLLLSFAMVLSLGISGSTIGLSNLLNTTAYAVTGSTVAADGTYTGYSKEGTVTVTVSNGLIASVTADVKSKYQSYITTAFSSVTGKAATYNNIDSVSAATKHIGYIKSGALSAISSAAAADGSESGGDDSGSSSGSSSGGSSSETEYTIAVGGTQTLSVTEDSYYTYSWTSSDTSKVTVSGNGYQATATGVAATDSAVTVSCTYGMMGTTNTKEFSINVTDDSSSSGSSTEDPDDETEIGSGVGEKNGTKYTGTAYVNDDEEDEWVKLDVYVEDGKIVGIFIADEDGSWLKLLTTIGDDFLGLDANSSTVDAVSSATTKGFRDTIRNAIFNALSDLQEDTTAAPVLTSGDGDSYTKGSSSTLTFISDAEFSTFESVKVDGSVISSNYYTAKSGSTEVTLKSEYLETLGTGSHSIAIVSETGTASGTFTVAASASESGSSSSNGSYTGTIVSALTDGDYIIVDRYNSSYSYSALGNSTAGSSGSGYGYTGVDVTIDGNSAIVTDAAGVWTWNSSNNSFYNSDAGVYLAMPSDLYSASGFFSSSAVSLNFYTISGNEATVYRSSGNGGYYLNAAYPSNNKAFTSSKATSINSSYLVSGQGVNFYKIDSTTEKKAEISLSKTSSSLELGGTDTVTATSTGCDSLTVLSSNTDSVTATISGNTITVTGVAAGSAVITVNGTATSGYSDPDSVTFTVTVSSGSSGGSSSGSTTTTTPGDPTYVKSISPDGEAADNYVISLNVTADDLESSTTTPGTSGSSGTNLVMVIDTSGSIKGKETALNTAIQSLVSGLSDNSQVGVVTFNNSASSGTIYSKSTISSLTFSANTNASTYMGSAITNAQSLLNGSGWTNTGNDKAIVIISDFATDDTSTTINNARTVKGAGTTIYSVKIDVTSVNAANTTSFYPPQSDETSRHLVARYVSSQYPNASETAGETDGGIWGFSVTPGTEDTSATYVYGAGGGNWSEIFAEIAATEGMTETSTLPMKDVVIKDTLSDYVELSSSDSSSNYGITLETSPTDSSVSIGSVSVDGKEISVSLSGTLTDGTTYTVKIPVKPAEQAHTETDQSAVATQTYYSNAGATLAYAYDDDNTGTVTYAEKPYIVVARQVTLTYDDNVEDEEITVPDAETATVAVSGDDANKAAFTISSTVPEREGYTFLGWNTDKGATEADTDYAKNASVSLGANTTLYAIWQANTHTVSYSVSGDVPDGYTAPTGSTESEGSSVTVEDAPESQTGTKDGVNGTYTFEGWTAPDGVTVSDGSFTMPASDVAFTGVWTFTADTHKVSYSVSGDVPDGYTAPTGSTESEGSSVTVEDAPESQTGTKDGVSGTYTFEGWTAPEGVTVSDGSFTMPASDVEFTGVWTFTAGNWTITWKNDDGTQTYTTTTVTDGDTPTYNETPEKELDDQYTYTFVGWATTANAVEVLDKLPAATADATYYAVFSSEQTKFQIIFEDYTKNAESLLGGLELEKIEDKDNCYISKYYYSGDVTFTIAGDKAVIAGIHTDESKAGNEKLLDPNGKYERIFCSEAGQVHEFTISVTGEDTVDGDKYVILAYNGDINMNGTNDTADASMAAKMDTGKFTGNNLQVFIGDVNADGKNSTDDASMCAKADTGKRAHTWNLLK